MCTNVSAEYNYSMTYNIMKKMRYGTKIYFYYLPPGHISFKSHGRTNASDVISSSWPRISF
jgi:hypothetical protein